MPSTTEIPQKEVYVRAVENADKITVAVTARDLTTGDLIAREVFTINALHS